MNRKKISVITLHHVTNYGSLLQTFALQEHLTSLGYDVEYIDFIPYGLRLKAALFPKNDKRSFLKKIVRFFPCLVCNLIEMNDMNRFLNRYINLTAEKYYAYSDLKKNVPVADVYVNGSDQVWNIQNDNEKDDLKAYLLCFVPDAARKISYAGSFGREGISEAEKKLFAKAFSRYNLISVREDSAKEIINELGFDSVEHVIDPTLLLSDVEWSILAKTRIIKEDYILVYNLNRNIQIKENAIALSQKTGLRIVNFADTFDFINGAKNRLHNKPEDFLSLFKYASYILTDSFHGTAFSINFNRTFMVYPAPKYNGRIASIIRMFGLEDRFTQNTVVPLDVILKPINWEAVNTKLDAERVKADNFLKKGLE